jgi:hypothetical protein
MRSDSFKGKAVKAESAFNVVPQNVYLDSEYDLKILPISAVTPTGLLTVLRLEPTALGLPAFVVRWDGKKNTIDVDLEGNSSDGGAFRAERDGCKGHHPTTVSSDPRVFKIDIQLPGRKVYEALLTCNIGLSATLEDTFEFRDEASVKVLSKPAKRSER